MTDNQDQKQRDFVAEKVMEKETVTTDAVAGETVLPGVGEGNDGPTGGAPAEGTPDYQLPNPNEELATDLRSEE
jgi:hypothetical protein